MNLLLIDADELTVMYLELIKKVKDYTVIPILQIHKNDTKFPTEIK